MIWDRSLHALIPRNPILVRDLRYQQRTTSFLRGFIESVGVVAIALCFSVAMLFYVLQEIDPQGWLGWLKYRNPIQLLAWTFHAAAALRLLAAGVSVISPDTYLLDSDDLMVTPLNNWQLLTGKWWAALHQTRGWMLALGIVQLGIVVSSAFGLLMNVDWESTCTGGPCVTTIYGLARPRWFTPERLLFIVASAIGLAILEALCCTVLGMAAAIVVRSKLGLICAISLRFAPVIIFSLFPDFSWAYLLSNYRGHTWFSFADAGTGAIIQMTHPINIYASGFDRGVLGLCAVSGMFLIYLGLSLVTSWTLMRRSRRGHQNKCAI